ncbi:MAG: LysE family transporter [Betaproteobacteria bacterium]
MSADFWSGFATSLALIVAIGSQNAFVLRQGILRQHVAALVVFCAASDALLIVAGIAGAGALVQGSPVFMEVTRIGGALFLAAYALLAARRALQGGVLEAPDTPGQTLGATLASCFAFTFLNPHVYLDTVVLLGSVANQRGDAGRWWFGTGAALASGVWFAALGIGARWLQPMFAHALAWRVLDGLIALAMGCLALMVWFSPPPVPVSL